MQRTDTAAFSTTAFPTIRSQDASIPARIGGRIKQNRFGHFTEHLACPQILGARMIEISVCQARERHTVSTITAVSSVHLGDAPADLSAKLANGSYGVHI